MTDSFDQSLVSINQIFSKKNYITQHISGYRFSEDALCLSWFVFHRSKTFTNILEIGGGSGVISITLCRRGFSGSITCIENSASLFPLLKHNITANALNTQITPVFGDIRNHLFPAFSFDGIFTNPPFFSTAAGRASSNSEKAAARHEYSGGIAEFFTASIPLLKPHGLFFVIYPISRLDHLLRSAEIAGFFLVEGIYLRNNAAAAPSLFLGTFSPTSTQQPVLYKDIYLREGKNFTDIGMQIMYE